MRLSETALLVVLVGSGYGCTTRHKSHEGLFIETVVESDPGLTLSDIPVYVDGEVAGRTDRHGVIRVSLFRRPGDIVTVSPACPEGHRLVEPVTAFRVRRYRKISESSAIQLRVRCHPSVRLAAFVVRAKNGPGINVLLDGVAVATTDANGIAQFSAIAAPGTEYIVQLDAASRPLLLPRRTSHAFIAPDADEIFLVHQVFHSRAPDKRARPSRQRIIKIE